MSFMEMRQIFSQGVKLWPLDHYRLLKGKIKGTRSMPYYSTKSNYPLLCYFTTTIHIVVKEIYKEQSLKVKAWYPRTNLSSYK